MRASGRRADSGSREPGTSSAAAPVTTSAAITARDLESRLTAFAHDTMMGREAGTIWNVKATDYVASQFQQLGLRPAGENGGYFQTVPNIRVRDSIDAARPRRATSSRSFPAAIRRCAANTSRSAAHNDHIGFTHRPVDHDSLRAFNHDRPAAGRRQSAAHAVDRRKRRRSARSSTRCAGAHAAARLDSQRRRRRRQRNDRAHRDRRGVREGRRQPRRSILLVSHTAEEKGLLGSAWYTDHATVPIDSIVAEFDVDMIGRGAAIGHHRRWSDVSRGRRTAPAVEGVRRLGRVGEREGAEPFVFNYEYDVPGHPLQYYCRADHYSYARYGIPSVSLSRGEHRTITR